MIRLYKGRIFSHCWMRCFGGDISSQTFMQLDYIYSKALIGMRFNSHLENQEKYVDKQDHNPNPQNVAASDKAGRTAEVR